MMEMGLKHAQNFDPKKLSKTLLMPTKVYSKKLLSKELNTLIDDLNNGGIIIYPTETIGLLAVNQH